VLRLMAEKNASDVYLSANTPILIKINGQILQLSDQPLTTTQTAPAAGRAADTAADGRAGRHRRAQRRHGHRRVGSFRLSAFKQRGSVAAVFRCIPHQIPSLDSLGVPPMLGAAGAGKARPDPDGGRHRHRQEHHAGVDAGAWRNQQMSGHILTIEDPIEFLFSNKKSHRQPARGRAATREPAGRAEERAAPGARLHPDRRDPRPRDHDLGASRMRCRATWCWPPARQQQLPRAGAHPVVLHARGAPALLSDLAAGLRAIVSQRLLRANGRPHPGGGSAAQHQAGVRADRKGDLSGVKEAMEKSMAEGSQTFEMDLARLIKKAPSRATKAWPMPIRPPT
jgi:twitching motility protein PilU